MFLGAAWASYAVAAEDILVKKDVVLDSFPEQEIQPAKASVANGRRETLDVGVISWRDIPFQTVKRQALDYSCGSAAVSTLLTYIYGRKVNEGAVFKAMFETGDKDRIRREGFSLLDMSNYINGLGFKSVGYKVSLNEMEKSRAPFIALINDNGYNHFVVVKSIKGRYVLIGDPNKGNVILARNAFEKSWNGIALVITNYARKAHDFFDNEKEWTLARRPADASSAGDVGTDTAALPSMQWQVAPARVELLSSLNAIQQISGGVQP